MSAWAGMSYPFLRDIENIKSASDKKKRLIDLLLSPASGFILPSMRDIEVCSRINKYCELALLERKPFEMITSQRLSIVFSRPERTPKDKNETIQSRQKR
jgi:hypothetical protein